MMQTKRDMLNDPGATLTTANMTNRTASYTIPQMASNNVVVNIGECDYCREDAIGFKVDYLVKKVSGRWVVEVGIDHCEWIRIEINYCPMCGRKLEVEE